ncbi:MAG: hypothetical protein LBB72_09715 [Spirochaetaceae bacterium]|jgi:hypothetical protein|nr:hypothetical protein [Spirochaetaceae bacterium]
MRKKNLLQIAVCLVICLTLVLMAACKADEIIGTPTGELVPGEGPAGGLVGGSSGPGWGERDPSFRGKRFKLDLNDLAGSLPSVTTWNQLGHQHAYPDPFHFANGNRVVTLADWENRRKEIRALLEYYEYGIMPSIDPSVVEITWVDSGVADCAITVTHIESGRTATWNQTTTLPAALQGPAYEGKAMLPLNLMNNNTVYTGFGGSGSFNTGTFGTEGDGSGLVHTLYGINTSDPSAPSGNSDYAWGMSVLLTVIEEGGFRGYYNPNWVAITGYSRGGKATMCISAFAESRKGARVGLTHIGSAGSGGPAIERFLSPAGYRVNGQYADPLPLDGPGLMEFEGLVGKPWYMKQIKIGDDIPGASGLAYAVTPGGSADDWRYTTVRGWSPYFDTFESTPTNYSTAVTVPFVGWQSPAESWSGIQSLSEGRNETPGWFSVRFREFADLHYGLDIDHVRGMEGRSKYGVLCTTPVDQHFLGCLIAPRGMIISDGYVVPRNNPESQFAHWLIADEVYRMYGELEGNPDKYIWNNAFMMTWGTHGGNNGNEGADASYLFRKIVEQARFNNGGEDAVTGSDPEDPNAREGDYSKFYGTNMTFLALSDANLMKMRTPFFQVDDPIGRFDYYRMVWGRPGHPTVAERIKRRIDPILTDYFAGEANRTPPAAFAPPVHPSYTPTGPKFKAMDWRGLLDEPEPLN